MSKIRKKVQIFLSLEFILFFDNIIIYILLCLFPDNKLLNSLISCEPETVLAMPDSSVPDDEKITLTLSNLYEKQLVGIIEWGKQILGLY